jgi:hypothetical protein
MPTTRKLSDEERKARRKETVAKYYKNHTAKCVAARKRCRDANPTSTKSIKLKTLYGITLEERDALFAAQGSVCAICQTDTAPKNGWHTDHCHETEKVRGILCLHCNAMLGMARDNTTTLARAITYLKVFNGEEAHGPI